MFNRFLLTIGFLVGGLNLIWFGCQYNGSNNRRNPIWGFIDGFVEFEKYILYAVLVLAASAALLYLLHLFVNAIQTDEKSELDRMTEERLKRNAEEGRLREMREARYQAGLELFKEQAREQQSKGPAHEENKPSEPISLWAPKTTP